MFGLFDKTICPVCANRSLYSEEKSHIKFSQIVLVRSDNSYIITLSPLCVFQMPPWRRLFFFRALVRSRALRCRAFIALLRRLARSLNGTEKKLNARLRRVALFFFRAHYIVSIAHSISFAVRDEAGFACSRSLALIIFIFSMRWTPLIKGAACLFSVARSACLLIEFKYALAQ